jgi:hypothetical protein
MIRVRLLTQIAGAGAAIASLPMMLGCSGTDHETSATQAGDLAETGIEAGTGTLAFYNYAFQYRSTSNGDEFVRVGERLQAQISFYDAVNLLWRDASDQALIESIKQDPSKLTLTLKLTYTKFDDTKFDATPLPITFSPGAGGVSTGTSPEFTVPEKVKGITADFIATVDGQTRDLLASQNAPANVIVFGGFVPDKLVLLDTNGSDRRTRIIEGGGVVPGANLTVSVTDWRLDTVVDKTTLDLRYGKKQSYSRFGPTVIDAVGDLDYVVSAAISIDDGKTFMPLDLDRVANADVVHGQYGRAAYQKTFAVPSNATGSVQVAVHVQAYLQVPSYYPSEVTDAKYGPGQRVLLKDMWDNAGGANYHLPISQE